MPTDQQREAFVTALREHASSTERRKLVMEVTGKSKGMISRWLQGEHIPLPDQIFAIEKACELPPGDLSRHLGYVPIGSSSLLAAMTSDETLTPKQRRALEVMYRTVLSVQSS